MSSSRAVKGLLLLASVLASTSHGKTVLFLTMANAPSHTMNIAAMMGELAARGHTVFISAHHSDLKLYKGLNESSFLPYAKDTPTFAAKLPMESGLAGKRYNLLVPFSYLYQLASASCSAFLTDYEAKLEDLRVDLIFSDLTWECGAIVSAKLNKPIISFFPGALLDPFLSAPYKGSLRSLPISSNTAYLPQNFFQHDRPQGLWQRLVNSYQSASMAWFDYTVIRKIIFDLHAKHGVDLTTPAARARHVLSLLPLDPAIEIARPLPPSIKMVGSILSKPVKPLPSDFEDFILSQGEKGLVVAAFGTITSTGKAEQLVLAEAFSSLPVAVVWKLSEKDIPDEAALAALNLGPNVKVSSWLPQNDLLGHPKARAFLSHCGANSFYESLTHGVPIIARPGFGDQPFLARRAVARGVGVNLAKKELTVPLVREAVLKVLEDPSYKANAEAISTRLRARVRTPLQDAGDWVEHVLATGGVNYWQAIEPELSFVVRHRLDQLAVLGAALLASLLGVFLLVRGSLRLVYGKGSDSVSAQVHVKVA